MRSIILTISTNDGMYLSYAAPRRCATPELGGEAGMHLPPSARISRESVSQEY